LKYETRTTWSYYVHRRIYNHLLPVSVSSQVDYYTSKVTAVVSMTLTAADIQGADLSEQLVLFGIAIQKVPGNTLDSNPHLALTHPKHPMPSHSPISITWKSVEGGTRILTRVFFSMKVHATARDTGIA